MAAGPLFGLLAASALADGSWSTVVFDTPTSEPGKNRAKQPIISGGLPIGNGETAALVFPTTKDIKMTDDFELKEGVHVWLGMTTAMASDMAPFSLGVVSIVTDPPLGTSGFNQTLDLATATVTVATAVGTVRVWVDANSNLVTAEAVGAWKGVTVSVLSLRPTARFPYNGRCSTPTSEADEVSAPAGPNSVGLSHRNMDEDIALLNKPAAFNATLEQQGLSAFTEALQGSDKWRGRQFGLVVTGTNLVACSGSAACLSGGAAGSYTVSISTLAKQTASSAEWGHSIGQQHQKAANIDSSNRVIKHAEWWTAFWGRSHIWVSGAPAGLAGLTERYAQTRYVQAIQAGTWVPIKFNGMIFTAQLPPETTKSGPSFRQWGSSNWWQNTRLAYWNMIISQDFEQLSTIFDYYLQMNDFLKARTMAAFNHTGIYVTETKTLFGAYDPCDYGTDAGKRGPKDLNFGYQESRWLKYDFGGDAGLPELCVMLLDHHAYTLDDTHMAKYLPLLSGTLDFFAKHYGDVEASDEKLTIFPAQGLETYQCPTEPATPDNCPTNDHPTLAALYVLTERALQLPTSLTTPAQRAQWTKLQAALPPIPMIVEDAVTVVSPYSTYPNPGTVHKSNGETPELYSTHPFRYFTLGTSRSAKRDIAPSLYCLDNSTRNTCRNSDANSGWTQGLLNAALLGRADKAASRTLARSQTGAASGYRFPAFAPHEQDYEPSEDHLANMNSALQLMLLSSADDGLAAGGALLFPAWPCAWDVDFKLAAPRQTTVSGKLVNGTLTDFVVDPPSRKSAITVLPCQ